MEVDLVFWIVLYYNFCLRKKGKYWYKVMNNKILFDNLFCKFFFDIFGFYRYIDYKLFMLVILFFVFIW